MRWILYIGAALVAVAVLIALVGAMLPKAHVASRKAHFHQTQEALFAAISGPADWRTDIKGVEALAPVNGRKRWKEVNSWGEGVLYELVEATPPTRMITRIADETLPYGGSWTFDITPAAGGCELRITENGEVKNPIFRFLSRFVFGQTGSIEKYLTALGAKFGERVAIES